ncbi:MAG: hypothetical protein P1U36_03600 [Legionellaceae bacterium]|nr:hypothetical protein [Legionellaceae bacterium]
MLFTEINQIFFARPDAKPETTPYASLKTTHSDIKQEINLLEAALNALDAASDAIYDAPRELLQRGKNLNKRYDNIRGNENISFRSDLFYLHAYRISLTFARLNIAQMLSLFTFDQMAIVLEAPVPILYFFSVAFLATRLLLNFITAAKHALNASDEEKEGLPSGFERFTYELSLVATDIFNDIVWAGANLLTNYPQLLGLSNPVVNAILLICLTFDIGSSAYAYDKNEKAFAKKSREYEQALEQLEAGDINRIVISEQLKQLKLSYRGDKAKLEQYLAAGATILLAFSLIASSAYPLFLPLGAALCVFGTALYLTAGKRAECVKAPSAENDNAYAISLIKNTICPLLFMFTAASVGWPVAILVAVPIMILDNKEAITNRLSFEEAEERQELHLA